MSPQLFGALVDCAIPFFGGFYATLLGYRKVGKRPGEDARYDAWHDRYGRLFRILGPFLVAFAVVRLLYAVLVHP